VGDGANIEGYGNVWEKRVEDLVYRLSGDGRGRVFYDAAMSALENRDEGFEKHCQMMESQRDLEILGATAL